MTESLAKRQRLDFSDTITICVGEGTGKKDFIVHKTFATRTSSFIKAALSHDWKEAREQRITIPETEPTYFEGYLHWLYTGQIIMLDEPFDHGVRLYILGDFLGDDAFCNQIMDEHLKSGIPAPIGEESDPVASLRQLAELIWSNTPSESLLRKFFIDSLILTAGRSHGEWIAVMKKLLPSDLYVEVLESLARDNKTLTVARKTMAEKVKMSRRYHKHGRGEECAGV